MSTPQLGSWTDFNFNISHETHNVFETALHGFVGVNYKPLAAATQVVAGTNYCFLCRATVVSPGAEPYAAKVYINHPTNQPPKIDHIDHDTP